MRNDRFSLVRLVGMLAGVMFLWAVAGAGEARAQSGSITGTVTRDTGGTAVPNIQVVVYTPQGTYQGQATSAGDGTYTVTALAPGNYVLRTFLAPAAGLIDEYHASVPCPGPQCTPAAATQVTVQAGQATTVNVGLAAAGSISGTVRNSSNSAPIEDVSVGAYLQVAGVLYWAGAALSDASGAYVVRGLPSGTYFLFTNNDAGFVDEVFDLGGNRVCPGAGCTVAQGSPITVVQGSPTPGIDFALDPGGAIAGTVRSDAGMESGPLEMVNVTAYLRLAGGGLQFAGESVTAVDGAYTIGGLPGGSYVVRTSNVLANPGFVDELYDGISCPAGNCDLSSGGSVAVALAQTTASIDFALAEGVNISGYVQEDCGDFPCTPITDASVEVYDQWGSYLSSVSPEFADGSYRFPALPAGSYRLRVQTYSGNYVDEAWNNIDCVANLCDMSLDGDLLPVVVGEPATVDFFLRPGGRITGTVVSADGGGALGGVAVEIWKLAGGQPRYVKSVFTSGDGTYVAEGLPGGLGEAGYRLLAYGGSLGHASEVHAGQDCLNFACDVNGGLTVDVIEAETTSGVGFNLNRLGVISGAVTAAATGQALVDATVTLFDGAGTTQVGQTATDGSGVYQFSSLVPGSYKVRAAAAGYRSEVFDDVKCTGAPTFTTCDVPSGGAVAASLNTTTGANVALDRLHMLNALVVFGTGKGRVTSASPAGVIDCRNDGGGPSDCSEVLVEGTPVTLTATPASGSVFAGWSHAGCPGPGNCAFTMTGPLAIAATFDVVPGGSAPTVTAISPASGPLAGGTEVNIFGTNLIASPVVTFGGVPAQLVSGVVGRITVTSPPGTAGPKDVVVTTAGGQATVPGGFTYTTDAKVSDEAAGGNGQTLQPSLSYDGRHLAFLSLASNLVTDDTNGEGDVFVRDRVTGVIVRVSVASDGTQADGASERPRISDDGRFVTFVSTASNLVPGDTNAAADVFVHDRDADANGVFDEPGGRATFRVSVASDGRQADGPSVQPDISADGRWVAFVSSASNLVTGDTNGVDDVFLHHWPSGQTRRVSVGTGGVEANGPSRAPSVSDAGRRVVFASDATTLVPNDGNGVRDVFLHEREEASTVRVSTRAGTEHDADGPSDNPSIDNAGITIAFQTTASNVVAGATAPPGVTQVVVLVIAPSGTLSAAPLGTGDARRLALPVVNIADAIRQLVSQNAQGQGGNGPSTSPEVSGGGTAVAFESEGSDITLGDTNGATDVFLANVTDTGDLTPPVRVSTDASGNQAAGRSQAPALSGDGRLTSFESDAKLTPGSTGGTTSIFVRGERLLVSRLSSDSATVGTALTIDIEGTGLQDGVQVRFGGQLSPEAQRLSATLVKAVVPQVALPTVVDVTVSNPDGESVLLRRAFTYAAAPLSGPDTDLDGLPDAWEVAFGLDPSSASGANGADGDPDGDGVANADELARETHPRGTFVRYLAEGASTDFFATRVALVNPSSTTSANVLLRFQKKTGGEVPLPFVLPPGRSRKIVVNDVPGMLPAEFATVVESDNAVVVDRQMWWSAETAYGSHAEGAVRAPGTVWYLAEGATHSGFDLFYLLQNPSPSATAQVRVRYLRPSGSPIEKSYTVAPGSRFNIWVDYEEFPGAGSGNLALADTDVSAVVEVLNGVPIIVERAMYLSRGAQFFAAGHESAGVPAPALTWFLAEGATGDFFDEFILLANPNGTAASATITYLLEGGVTYARAITLPANSRQTVWVDLERPDGTTGFPLAAVAVSARVEVTNGVPIIVERAMWWSGAPGNWHEAHNSPGSTVTGTLWALAEGEVIGTARTYILVANTSAQAGEVDVTLVFDGISPVTRRFQVPGTSRLTIDVGREFPESIGREFGALAESVGPGPVQIVVERAMYNDAGGVFWAAGSNQLATRLR